jgi:hypothetical protein
MPPHELAAMSWWAAGDPRVRKRPSGVSFWCHLQQSHEIADSPLK